MTKQEKEQVIRDAVGLLNKIHHLNFTINKMWNNGVYSSVQLGYVKNGKNSIQDFGFTRQWFDPEDFHMSYCKDLKVPPNSTDMQKVTLKLAYYFYNWFNKEAE